MSELESDCPFCAMAAGASPASVAYEDDRVIAFMDTGPVNPGHLLVVPRRHAASLADLDEDTGAHLFRVTLRMAAAVRGSGVRCEGVNLFLADGEAAFQEVFHAHVHVFPRFRGDGFRVDADWSQRPARDELDRVAALIRRADEAERARIRG